MPSSIPCCIEYCSFIVALEIEKSKSSTLPFIILSWIIYWFAFPHKIKIILSISIKQLAEILTELCWISRLSWKNWNLNNIESFIHEQEISIHLFKCTLIKVFYNRYSLFTYLFILFSSVQFSHSAMSKSLWSHGLKHVRLPCPSPTPGTYSNPCALSQWCHPTVSSSVVPFSSHLQSFPASESFQRSQLFTSGVQSIGVSASASVLPMSIQDWLPLRLTGWISLQSKGPSRVFSNTTVQKHQFFSAQLSL